MILEMRKLASGLRRRLIGKGEVEVKFLLVCRGGGGKELDLAVAEGRKEKSRKQPVRQVWRRGRKETKLEESLSPYAQGEEEVDVVVVSRGAIGTNQEGAGRETLGAGPRPEPGDPQKGDRGRELLRLQPKEGLGLKTLI